MLSKLHISLALLLAAAASAAAQKSSTLITAPDASQRFLSGINFGNVPLLPFAKAANLNCTADALRAYVTSAFSAVAAANGNTIRLWLHIDGSLSPDFDPSSGTVSGVSSEFITDLQWTLYQAYSRNLLVLLNLWSHDIMAARILNPPGNVNRTIQMIADEGGTQAYIDNALLPMLRALAGSNMSSSTSGNNDSSTDGTGVNYLAALIGIEIFNEPEGVSDAWRLYWDYQYGVQTGNYQYYDPASYNAEPGTQANYENITYLYSVGGFQSVSPNQPGYASYNGPYFVGTDGTLNTYLYHDFLNRDNSEFPYMLDQIQNHALKTQSLDPYNVLRFINRVAGAIKREVPGVLKTVGAHSIPYNTDRTGLNLGTFDTNPKNWYSDSMLISAGGDLNGTLDFYEVHGYPDWSDTTNLINQDMTPWFHPYSYWQLDKPLLIGEFWNATDGNNTPVTVDTLYKLYTDGYAGGMGWAYYDYTEPFAGTVSGNAWLERCIKPHQMQPVFMPLIAELAAKLGSRRL